MSMTSWERVMAALNHKKPDRPPLHYFGTPETSEKLKKHLNIATDEELLCYLGSDFRYVSARYIGPKEFVGETGFECGGRDIWGIIWKPVNNKFCTYYEPVFHPLACINGVKEVEKYPWPSPDWFDVSYLKEEIEGINGKERRAIVFCAGGLLETAWWMRGFERFLLDLIEYPEIAQLILMKITNFCQERTMRAIESTDGQLDIIWSLSDIGGQEGMLFSPELWRKHIKPWQRELITPFKKMGFKTRYHSDGSLIPVIEDLIEMGLDILDPIQPKAKDMDAENLNKLFGGKLSFYGGMDAQELFPRGTAKEIEKEVTRLINVLGKNGGYIVGNSNSTQPDVPVENILTMFKTARQYKY